MKFLYKIAILFLLFSTFNGEDIREEEEDDCKAVNDSVGGHTPQEICNCGYLVKSTDGDKYTRFSKKPMKVDFAQCFAYHKVYRADSKQYEMASEDYKKCHDNCVSTWAVFIGLIVTGAVIILGIIICLICLCCK